MAELVFHTGPMDCGKSTLALQLDYTQSTHGRKGRVFTSQDRAGAGLITSRLGLSVQAIEVDEGFDFWRYVIGELTTGNKSCSAPRIRRTLPASIIFPSCNQWRRNSSRTRQTPHWRDFWKPPRWWPIPTNCQGRTKIPAR